MALTDRDIVITPNKGAASTPNIRFIGADASNSATITLSALNSGAVGQLSFTGTAGTLANIYDSATANQGYLEIAGYSNNATSTITGALRVAGGVGIGRDLWVGGSATVAGNISITGTINGTVSNATNASNVNITDASYQNVQYFPTFVDNNSGFNPLKVAAYNLSFYPQSSQLILGTVNASALAQVTVLSVAQRGRDGALQIANTGTNAGGGIILAGANATSPYIQFYTYTGQVGSESANERMRVNPTGLAVGTSNVTARLTVSGANTSSTPLVDLTASGTGSFQRGVRLLNGGLGTGDSIMYAVGQADSAKNMGQMYFYYSGTSGSNSNSLRFGLHSVDDVLTIAGSGNVGVGNTAPYSKLDVAFQNSINTTTPGTSPYGIYLSGQSTNDQATGITFSAGGATAGTAQAGIYVQGSGSYGTKMYFATTDSYATGAKTRAMIDYNGNVGINTTSPGGDVTMAGGLEINAGSSTALTIGKSGSRAFALNPGQNTTGDFQIFDKAGGSYNYALYSAYGKVLIGQGGPGQGQFNVRSTTGTGSSVTTWSTGHSIFGPNVTSQTGAALGIAYNTSTDQAEVLSLAPSVAWKPLALYSNGLYMYANSGAEMARLTSAGLAINKGSAATEMLDVNGNLYFSKAADPRIYAGSSVGLNIDGQALYLNRYANSTVAVGLAGGGITLGTSSTTIGKVTIYKTGTTTYPTADASSTAHLTLAGTDSLVRLQFGTLNAAPYAGWIQASYDNGSGSNGIEPLLLNPGGGNVQIGITADQGYKLFVNGTTRTGNFYAPIFYDSDDTNYYVDPAGTSIINSLVASSTIGDTMNYATSQGWAVSSNADQTGYYGGNFGRNGDGNLVAWGLDPFGRRGLLWQTRSNDASSDADGGWDKSISGLTANKAYMSVVYVIRRSSSTNGSFYHGCSGGNTLNISDNSANGNPYFHAFGIGTLPQDVWCVSIGIIRANNDSNTSNTGVSGVYRMDTGQRIVSGQDYKMGSGTTQTHRTYLYYSTDPAASLDWWGPGFYEINGLEPSIDTLVGNVNTAWSKSWYAPYYFDSANTGYYARPSGTSNFYNLDVQYQLTAGFSNGRPATISGTNWSARIGGNDVYGVMGSLDGTNGYPFVIQSMRTSDGASFPLALNPNGGNVTINQTASLGYSLGINGIGYSNTSLRAPIFYDSNDTSYFADPASRSRLSSIDYGNSGYYFAGGDWGWRHNTPYGWIQFGPANTGHAHIYTDRSNFYFNVYDLYANGRWILTESYWQNSKYFGTGGEIYGTIFYDSNDSGYYTNPNSTSNIKYLKVNTDGTASSTRALTIRQNGDGEINFGSYPGAWTSALQIQNNGATAHLWLSPLTNQGASYIYSSQDPIFFYGSGGFGGAAYSGSLRSAIFYDYNDTSYYADPNSFSQFKWLRLLGDWGGSGVHPEAFTIRGSYPSITLRSTSGSAPVWLLHNDNGSTLYWYNQQGSTDGTSWSWRWNVNSSGSSIVTGDMRAPIFYDYNDTGYYCDPNYISQFWRINASNYLYSSGAVYGTVFYDTNDSAYYADFNSGYGINWQGISSYSKMRIGMTYKYNTARNDYTSDSNYWVGSNGWGTTDFNTMADWGFCLTDSWSNPGNQPSGTSHWGTLNNIHHYTNGSNRYGWQLTLGAGDPSLLYVRGVWGGGFSSWYKVAIYENNSNAARAFYASIYYDSNNTSYYVDPASGYNMLYGSVTFYNDSSGYKVYNAEGTGTTVRLGAAWSRPGVYNSPNFCIGAENYIEFVTGNSQRGYIDSSSNLFAFGSMRSPIWYDYNNTGYYIDGNSGSNILDLTCRIHYFSGVGGDSGAGNPAYAIYQVPGGWSNPYPDLGIGYHTGIRIGAYYGYNGTRFYNNHDWSTQIGSFGDGDNNLRSYYDIIAYASDGRLKENFRPLDNALDKVCSLTGTVFDWKDMVRELGFEPNAKTEVGVIAQQVEAVLPEAVTVAPFDYDWKQPNQSKSGERYLTVKYERLVPLLIEAIKEQRKEVDELRQMIKDIKDGKV